MRVVVQALCIWVLGWGVLVVKAEDQNAKQSHVVQKALEAAGLDARPTRGAERAIYVRIKGDGQFELMCDTLSKQDPNGWKIDLDAASLSAATLTKDLDRVPNLWVISFHRCDVPPFGKRIESVTSARWTECKLNADLLASLTNLPQLKSLKFQRCQFVDDAINAMPQLRSVTQLIVRQRNFPDAKFQNLLSNVPNVESLFLDECSLSDTSIPDLRGFRQLRHLNVSNNRISRLQHIPSTLEGVTADDTILGDSGIEDLINATKGRLRALSLYGCDVTDAGLGRISQGLPNLWYLEIGGHKMTNEGIGQLKTLPKLESFSVPLEYPELEDGYETVMKAVRPRIRKKAAERRARQKGG